MNSTSELPKVKFVTTGDSIAMKIDIALNAAAPELNVTDMLSGIPDIFSDDNFNLIKIPPISIEIYEIMKTQNTIGSGYEKTHLHRLYGRHYRYAPF